MCRKIHPLKLRSKETLTNTSAAFRSFLEAFSWGPRDMKGAVWVELLHVSVWSSHFRDRLRR